MTNFKPVPFLVSLLVLMCFCVTAFAQEEVVWKTEKSGSCTSSVTKKNMNTDESLVEIKTTITYCKNTTEETSEISIDVTINSGQAKASRKDMVRVTKNIADGKITAIKEKKGFRKKSEKEPKSDIDPGEISDIAMTLINADRLVNSPEEIEPAMKLLKDGEVIDLLEQTEVNAHLK